MTAPAQAITVGVVADTHIPDRVRALHPDVLPILRAARVSHILHAGDISVPSVLEELAELAPVTAVRGNRDIVAGVSPMAQMLTFGGARVALLHGHGGWLPYLRDKWKFLLYGYQRERYLPLLRSAGAGAQVIVFGHTHYAELFDMDGQLVLNPGSASCPSQDGRPPSLALLHIAHGGQVSAEILPLTGWGYKHRAWVRDPQTGL